MDSVLGVGPLASMVWRKRLTRCKRNRRCEVNMGSIQKPISWVYRWHRDWLNCLKSGQSNMGGNDAEGCDAQGGSSLDMGVRRGVLESPMGMSAIQ